MCASQFLFHAPKGADGHKKAVPRRLNAGSMDTADTVGPESEANWELQLYLHYGTTTGQSWRRGQCHEVIGEQMILLEVGTH
jgi:hypothetical protein